MLNITTIIGALSTIASAVDRIQERKKANHETERNRQSQGKRLEELEEADLEHERLIGELSSNVRELAKAIDAEIQNNRQRDATTQRLVYVALALAGLALIISIVVLLR